MTQILRHFCSCQYDPRPNSLENEQNSWNERFRYLGESCSKVKADLLFCTSFQHSHISFEVTARPEHQTKSLAPEAQVEDFLALDYALPAG